MQDHSEHADRDQVADVACLPGGGWLQRLARLGICWALPGTLLLCGCTSLSDYVHNGFKVGPNYARPPAPVAEHWIDANDVRVRSVEGDDSHWWTVFGDPVLDDLVQAAYRQNLTLRQAGFLVLQYRAQLAIAKGELFPQTQQANGDFHRTNLSSQVANRVATPELYFNQWDFGFGLAWEIDFWGRFRRAIESAGAELDANVENYDDVLVTLIGDVASEYVNLRTLEQRIAYAQENLTLQKTSLRIATARFKGGQASEMDANQGQSDVYHTEALIQDLEIQVRQSGNRLCELLGIPPEDLHAKLIAAPIPTAPREVAVGVPCDLLRRRPDVRRAEREAAAQSAQIGVAESNLYPAFSIDGTFGWSAQEFNQLFKGGSARLSWGPSFTWDLLNYGRLVNGVRVQDAKFEQLVVAYQATVLKAGKEVENGLVAFLKSQNEVESLNGAVKAEQRAMKEAIAQYEGGLTDFNRVAVIQEHLVDRQEQLAQVQGQLALGLIQVYRALGGGWQIRCDAHEAAAPAEAVTPAVAVKQDAPAEVAPAKP